MRKNKSNSAITLIALIITIIVLLILAGVTLSMVMGNSGIFGKANSAKEKTQKTTAEETIELAVLENKTTKASGEESLSNEALKAEIAERLRNLGYFVSEDNSEVTYYEDKKININAYLTDEDSGDDKLKTTGITAADIQKHPDWYYGKKVTDYSSVNGQDDWKIFYSDGTHIFLITGDYVDLTVADRLDSNTGMTTTSSKNNVAWGNVNGFQEPNPAVLSRFKANGFTLNSSNNKSIFASTMLNTSNWVKYLDNESGSGKAEYAIGGSTIEMWMDSWNNLYGDIDGMLYCNNTNDSGYYLGTSSELTQDYIVANAISVRKGYSNKLYYPHTSISNSTWSYWLSSPTSGNKAPMINVTYNGSIGENGDTYGYTGLRPVVSLNTGITVDAVDAE